MFSLNIILLGIGLLPPRRGLNQDKFLCLIVNETISELESHDPVDHVIYWYRKHRQLACQEGGFVACFPLNVSMVHSSTFVACFPLNILMVHSSTLIITTDGEHLTCGGFFGETIRFGSLEFITDCFSSLSLSPKGSDSGAIFVGATRFGSPSL
jgi:hypothetical protein